MKSAYCALLLQVICISTWANVSLIETAKKELQSGSKITSSGTALATIDTHYIHKELPTYRKALWTLSYSSFKNENYHSQAAQKTNLFDKDLDSSPEVQLTLNYNLREKDLAEGWRINYGPLAQVSHTRIKTRLSGTQIFDDVQLQKTNFYLGGFLSWENSRNQFQLYTLTGQSSESVVSGSSSLNKFSKFADTKYGAGWYFYLTKTLATYLDAFRTSNESEIRYSFGIAVVTL